MVHGVGRHELAAVFSHPNPGEVLRGTFVPTFSLDSSFLTPLVAILGTTISPYLFFSQSNQEVEEEISMGRHRLWQRRGASEAELKYAAMDVNVGMALSCLVMYFIIFATAATLFKAGKTDINSATDAAEALRPIAGDACTILLAIGLIGAGFLAVPILTAAALMRCRKPSAGAMGSTATPPGPNSSTPSSRCQR